MLKKNNQFSYKNLTQMTANGLLTASFVEIRDALAERYREIFGNDIDISSATADGQWIEEQALIINNMIESLKSMYSQFNPALASGKMLDIICSFNNVYRKQATNSIATITVKFNEDADFSEIQFYDGAGNIWIWTSKNADNVHFEANKEIQLTVKSTQLGPVRCNAGTVINTVEALNCEVIQIEDGSIGSYAESDDELRARRTLSLSSTSSTVTDSIIGALLNIYGIEDVRIYDNGNASTADDGTSIAAHKVYVIIKQRDNVEIADSAIGSVIYNMLTPGIITAAMASTVTNGKDKSYNNQEINGIIQTVHWKKADRIKPEFTVAIEVLPYWTDDTAVKIYNVLCKKLASLRLGERFEAYEAQQLVADCDPRFRNKPTFKTRDVTLINYDAVIGKDAAYKEMPEATNFSDVATKNSSGIVTISVR